MDSIVTPVTPEFRDPNTFVGLGDSWDEFLRRWNDRSTTRQEAMGLLHDIADMLNWDNRAFGFREDSREIRVRFLLHYAGNDADVGWIRRKAYQVLTDKVLRSKYLMRPQYLSRKSEDELVIDVVNFLQSHLPDSQPGERHVEEFLRAWGDWMRDMQKHGLKVSPKLRSAFRQLANALFRSRHAFAEIFEKE